MKSKHIEYADLGDKILDFVALNGDTSDAYFQAFLALESFAIRTNDLDTFHTAMAQAHQRAVKFSDEHYRETGVSS